jgi:hypothetical protein
MHDEEETLLLYPEKKVLGFCTRPMLIVTTICAVVCVVILLIILIGLGISIYLLYPRIPDATIDNVQLETYTLSKTPTPAINLFFTFDVELSNDNFYDIKLEAVDLELYYQGGYFGNFSLQYENGTIIERRTANQVRASVIHMINRILITCFYTKVYSNGRLSHFRYNRNNYYVDCRGNSSRC